MGQTIVFSKCIGCDRTFGYNPMHVPCLRDPTTGDPEPICRSCVERLNSVWKEIGIEPIVPHTDAYKAGQS